jgi:hypothetical protein
LAFRDYQALQFHSRYSINRRWSVAGNYTLELKDDGNYEGEAAFQPAIPSPIGDFPEASSPARMYPDGKLGNFQRHKLQLWTIYDIGLARAGDVSVSGLWRVNSATHFSYVVGSYPVTDVQAALLAGAGYPDQPTQNIYFGDRGAGEFKGYGIVDFDVNYNVPVFRTARPFVKFDVFNLLNNQKLIFWNTLIDADPNSPKDNLGLPTGYIPNPLFGKATSNADFPVPFLGYSGTGGRTYRVSVGLRF